MSQKSQVLVVDDDLAMCGFLRTFLGDAQLQRADDDERGRSRAALSR